MSETGLLIIKTMCNIISGLFLVLAALFVFWGKWQQGMHEKMRGWLRNMWSIIGSSRWLTMPERVIRWTCDKKALIVQWLTTRLTNGKREFLITLSIIAGFIILIPSFGNEITSRWPRITLVIVGIYALILLILIILKFSYNLVFVLTYILCLVFFGSMAIAWLNMVLRLQIAYGSLMMLITVPVYSLILWMILLGFILALSRMQLVTRVQETHFNMSLIFGVGVSASFAFTLLALFLGHKVYPAGWVPLTKQMLISNVICDGFTLVATFWILDWALAKKGTFRIPQAILLDILVATLLACCSLYFGLVLTEHGLSPVQVLRVLIGKSPEGSGLEFGPYFWAMHTTFIPTVIYLLLIGVCWMAKFILTVAGKFTKKALQHEKPCELTAALFGIFVALFTALSWTLGSAEDWLEKGKHIEPPEIRIVEPNQVGND